MTSFAQAQQRAGLKLELPPLPAVIQYYDDFEDCYRSILAPNETDIWVLAFDGRRCRLNFLKFDDAIRPLVKTLSWLNLRRLAPYTCVKHFWGLRELNAEHIATLVGMRPNEIRSFWKILQSEGVTKTAFAAVKNLLNFLCLLAIGAWDPHWADLLVRLPLPRVDKYAAIRAGEVFLSVQEEAAIVRAIDDVAADVRSSQRELPYDRIVATAILVCSFQFGLRAKQIALLRVRDIRIWRDEMDEIPAVHLTFKMIKQRWSNKALPMVRRVKREWCPIFLTLLRMARAVRKLDGSELVFQSTSDEIVQVVLAQTRSTGRARTPRELRHTAAQRLVDAGATQEEVAAFLGHTNLETPLVYFRSSASQAERINRALGVSRIYQRVAKIAHDRFVSKAELASLKEDQQIGAAPHGIPISGIGGCASGQPACPFNPVMACYACRKFMPVADQSVHEKVLEDLRSIVRLFYTASREEPSSPAYLQLQMTISSVQSVLKEIEDSR